MFSQDLCMYLLFYMYYLSQIWQLFLSVEVEESHVMSDDEKDEYMADGREFRMADSSS